VNPAIAPRFNPWLVAAIVAAVLLLAAVLLVVSQLGLIHAIGSMLQGPQQMAPYGCGNSSGPC